jgi:hypothetical protein
MQRQNNPKVHEMDIYQINRLKKTPVIKYKTNQKNNSVC